MYLRALHVRARLFSLLGVAAILFAAIVIGYLAVRYQQNIASRPAGTAIPNIDSAVITILTRSEPLTIPALIIFVIAEGVAWRNEAAIHQERRHLEMLAMQHHYLEAIRQTQQTTP